MISIIIPFHNRVENVCLVLGSLEKQTDKNFEVVLSDDGSKYEQPNPLGIWLMKKDNEFDTKYVWAEKKRLWNASIPRNRGARLADGSHYLFLDSDVVLNPGAIEAYQKDIEENPDRVIIGPYNWMMRGVERDLDWLFEREDEVLANMIEQRDPRSKKFSEVESDEMFDSLHDGLACFGGNLLIPAETFWGVGGYDEETEIGLEDGDLGITLWKHDVKFSYESEALGFHYWHEPPKGRFPDDMKKHIDRLNMKHFNTTDPDHGLISASREAYREWGIDKWRTPPEWLKNE